MARTPALGLHKQVMPAHYIDTSVLLGKYSVRKTHSKLHPGPSGILSKSSLVSISMTSFLALTRLKMASERFSKKKRKLTRWREDMNFFVWWKQYFTHLLHCFVKHCFHHSKIKFISSRHRVISPIYNDTRVL